MTRRYGSSAGLWDLRRGEPRPYGSEETYKLGAFFLRDVAVEDRGCGWAWFKNYHKKVIGVDASGKQADIKADLRVYRNKVDGIFMRHVLEHNYNWATLLVNAIEDFQKKFFLALFTPHSKDSRVMRVDRLKRPDIAISDDVIECYLRNGGCRWNCYSVSSDTVYGGERVYEIRK